MPKWRILKDCTIRIGYTWHCGDGCCADPDSDEEYFKKDQEFTTFNDGLYEHAIDLDTFPYWNNFPWREEDACPRISCYEIERLLEEEAISEIEVNLPPEPSGLQALTRFLEEEGFYE